MYTMNVSRPFRKALAANATTSSFGSKVPTVTKPTNDGVIDLLSGGGAIVPARIKILPYGLGGDNDAFSVRLIGWHKIGNTTSGVLWLPVPLVELACTISQAVGVAGSPVLDTERFADTITIVTEETVTADVTRIGDVELASPGNNLIAHAIFPLRGFELLEFEFDQTTNTPTMNCLYALL